MTTLDQSTPRFGALLRRGLAAHALFPAVAIGFLIAFKVLVFFVPAAAKGSFPELGLGIATFSIPTALITLAVYIFVGMVMNERPEKPTKVLWARMKAILENPKVMASGLPIFASLLIFMTVFAAFKASIPTLQPFAWDQTFDAWDKILHFGYRPWEILQPIFGYAPLTFLLNINYNMWFIVMNLFWVHYAFMTPPSEERTRFFLAFMLIVLFVGTVFAILFSSAGPCYFTRIGLAPDPYAPLMSYLNNANQILPIMAVDTQDLLWRYNQENSMFGGISAMPSLHNATALLFVLAVWNKNIIIRRLMITHAILIFLGSIHLGWHYAVDSYIVWPIALLCWWAAGEIAKWWNTKPHVHLFNHISTVTP